MLPFGSLGLVLLGAVQYKVPLRRAVDRIQRGANVDTRSSCHNGFRRSDMSTTAVEAGTRNLPHVGAHRTDGDRCPGDTQLMF